MSTGRPTAPRWQALSGPLSLYRGGPGGDDRTKRGNGGSVGTGVERASQNDVMELVCDVPGTSTLATASCLATFRRHTTLPPTTADPRRILARHPRPRAAGRWMCAAGIRSGQSLSDPAVGRSCTTGGRARVSTRSWKMSGRL